MSQNATVAACGAETDRQWVVTAYALAFGSLLLLGGPVGPVGPDDHLHRSARAGESFHCRSDLGGTAWNQLLRRPGLATSGNGRVLPSALTCNTASRTDLDRNRRRGMYGRRGRKKGVWVREVYRETASWSSARGAGCW